MRGASLLLLCLLLPLSAAAQALTCAPTLTDSTSVLVEWDKPPAPQPYYTHTGYLLERVTLETEGRARVARGRVAPRATAALPVLPPQVTSYTEKGLAEGSYQYQLQAVYARSDGTEALSAYATWGTPQPCVVVVGPPPPPGDLTVRPPSP